MRKKLDTRFPAARIKKIMQTDEDVGKIAMAVPLLVSKALELFLQDLCDQTYNITIQRGAKTVNSLHLKQCVQSFNVFDFLREIVSKVPDLGGSDACNVDQSVAKRRKLAEEEENQSDEESTKSRVHKASHRGRGRGRGRPSRAMERETVAQHDKFEDDPDTPQQSNDEQKPFSKKQDNGVKSEDLTDSELVGKNIKAPLLNFDLNVDLNNDDSTSVPTVAPGLAVEPVDSSTAAMAPSTTVQAAIAPITGSVSAAASEMKLEEYPGWSLADVEKIAIDPSQLVPFNGRMEEDDEDYDEKESQLIGNFSCSPDRLSNSRFVI